MREGEGRWDDEVEKGKTDHVCMPLLYIFLECTLFYPGRCCGELLFIIQSQPLFAIRTRMCCVCVLTCFRVQFDDDVF